MTGLFTDEQISQLRTEYTAVSTIDPCGETYPKLIDAIDKMSVEQLKQIRDAKIRFLSRLAINRIPA